MNGVAELGPLLAGALAILLVLTAIGGALQWRLNPDGTNTVVENLYARIVSWWGMVAFLGLAILAGRIGVLVLFGLMSFAALREFLTLTTKRQADHWALAAAFFVVLPAQYLLIGIEWYGLYSIFIPVYAFLALPMISALRGDTSAFLNRIAETQWGLMICVFAGSHLPALLTLDIPGYAGRELLLIAFLVFIVQLADVVQYSWSKLMGGRPVVAAISGWKTWEGTAAGIAAGGAAGAMLSWLTPFSPVAALLLAVVSCIVGALGSLVMSAIKRDRGVRDWGHLLAGRGGFIDRLDSVVFAAPIFFHLVRFFYAS